MNIRFPELFVDNADSTVVTTSAMTATRFVSCPWGETKAWNAGLNACSPVAAHLIRELFET